MHQCAGIFSVLYTYDKIQQEHEQRNKVKKKLTNTIKQIYKWNEMNSAFIFPWRSTNITVQVSNSYKKKSKSNQM